MYMQLISRVDRVACGLTKARVSRAKGLPFCVSLCYHDSRLGKSGEPVPCLNSCEVCLSRKTHAACRSGYHLPLRSVGENEPLMPTTL